jgi:hypothetical protein
MDDPVDTPNLDSKKVAKIFNDAEEEAARVQQLHLESAEYAGYTRAAIHAAAPIYIKAAEASKDNPQLRMVVASGTRVAGSITNELHNMAEISTPILISAQMVSSSATLLVVTSDTTAAISFPGIFDLQEFEAPPFFAPNDDSTYKKLLQIDPPLAETYREVGQAFHGTTADPARAAISCMRQTIDHFFDYLAPKDAVRSSKYWKPKIGDDPLLVTRRERMTYATHTHIKDPIHAKTLLESIGVVLGAYKNLQRLHERNSLSEKQAYKALRITKTFIESWVEALTLPLNSPPT